MNDKQLLNAFINGMKGSKNPVIYGTGLFLQLVESLKNPNNDYLDYDRDFKNIESIEVDWESWNDPEYCLHFVIKRKNGCKETFETCVSSNPLLTWFEMGKRY